MSIKDMVITRDEFHRFSPRAEKYYVDAIMNGMDQIKAADITTPLRWCHFISQWAHETGGFRIVREKCVWSAEQMTTLWPHRFKKTDPIFLARYAACRKDEVMLAELAYGASTRPDLGNSEEGDGYAFRGGSFCQITGRSRYREASGALGVDFEGSPDLIENPTYGLMIAIWYWSRINLNPIADKNNARGVGNGINRGNPFSSKEPIGYKDRVIWFNRAWAIWGAGATPATTDLDVGVHSTEVQAIQFRLTELRYQPGNADGVFGPETGRAVAAFKADWIREHGADLEPGTIVGAKTKAALAEAKPIERPERQQATSKDLLEAGSQEMKAAAEMKVTGSVVTATGSVLAAEKVGLLEWAGGYTSSLPAMQSVATPIIETVRWGRENVLVFGVLAIGLLVWHRGWIVEKARLAAHRLGKNLSR